MERTANNETILMSFYTLAKYGRSNTSQLALNEKNKLLVIYITVADLQLLTK